LSLGLNYSNVVLIRVYYIPGILHCRQRLRQLLRFGRGRRTEPKLELTFGLGLGIEPRNPGH